MTTKYPNQLDSFINPGPNDPQSNPSHSAQHANSNDAIKAIETYVGTAQNTAAGTITARIAALEAANGAPVEWSSITGTPNSLAGYGISDAYTVSEINQLLTNYQVVLESGTNIKTINGVTLLGAGNIVIEGGSGGPIEWSSITGTPNSLAGYGIVDAYTITQIDQLLANYQPVLESGVNIKTINGATLLGAGNIVIGGGGDADTVDGWNVAVETSLPADPDPETLYFIEGPQPTTLAGYGITDAYTKDETDAKYPEKDGTGASGNWPINSDSSNLSAAVVDQKSGSKTIWTGTEAEFSAIVTKDPGTIYLRTA